MKYQEWKDKYPHLLKRQAEQRRADYKALEPYRVSVQRLDDNEWYAPRNQEPAYYTDLNTRTSMSDVRSYIMSGRKRPIAGA